MSEDARFHKILALAVNPAAQEGEAQAAFGKLRDLVRLNPHLTAPPSLPMPPRVEAMSDENTIEWRLIQIRPFWLAVAIDNLSGHAYNLGLKSRFACDFKENPTALTITCTGPSSACADFSQLLTTLIEYINSQPQTS